MCYSEAIIMDPQCEIVGKYVLPIFRSMLARELVHKFNLSQTEAAKKLGMTQAAVSQYLSSKRAYKGIEHVEEFLPKIQVMASETARKCPAEITPRPDFKTRFGSGKFRRRQ